MKEPGSLPAGPRIGAVIVTYRRPAALAQTLAAVARQSVPVELTVVVDNGAAGADGGETRMIAERFARVLYQASPENEGFGAGLAAGMERVRERVDPDYFWLLDDDSPPAPDAVRLSLAEHAGQAGAVGAVADRGGHLRWGRIVHDLGRIEDGRTREADFTLVDGALISRGAVLAAGYPRRDLFMMLEDFEYTTRIRAAGFRLLVRPRDGTVHRHLGAGAPWRGYYQARNLLRISLERRSPRLLCGWLLREAGMVASLAGRGKFPSVLMRLRGWEDAVRGRMGRTLEPPGNGPGRR